VLFFLAFIFEIVVAFSNKTNLLSGSLTLTLAGPFLDAINKLISVANEIANGVVTAANDIKNEGQDIGNQINNWGSSISHGIGFKRAMLDGRDVISLDFPKSRSFSFGTTLGGVNQGNSSWFDAINPIFLLFDAVASALHKTAIVTFVLCVVLLLWTAFITFQAYRAPTQNKAAGFFSSPTKVGAKFFGIGIVLLILLTYLVSLIPFILAASFWLGSKLVDFNGNLFFVDIAGSTTGSAQDAVLTGLASCFLFWAFILAVFGYRHQRQVAVQEKGDAEAQPMAEK